MNSKKWKCGAENANDIIATLNGTTLTFSGKGEMKDFSNIDSYFGGFSNADFVIDGLFEGNFEFYYHEPTPWNNNRILEKIIVEEGITHIGDCAFFNCIAVKSVEIPNSVESIGNASFKNCSNIESIELSENIKSIGISAFENCI